jgi:phosphatidylinositol dimannoside acyltransferase
VRELLSALRRNELLGLVTDRDINGTGPRIEFFGAPTTFPDGAAALAVRTGAPILAAVARLRPDGGFDGLIEPALDVPTTGDAKQDVLALTRAVAARLEYHIASHPQQWTVFQKRWPDAQSG